MIAVSLNVYIGVCLIKPAQLHIYTQTILGRGNVPDIVLYLGTVGSLTLLHSERPKLHRVLAVLSAVGLNKFDCTNNKVGMGRG